MPVDLTPNSTDYSTVLQQAAIAYRHHTADRPDAATLTHALLSAEKDAKHQHRHYPFAALSGQWRLCYTTGVRRQRQGGIRLRKGFYLPRLADAQIGFDPSLIESDRGQISNQVQLGGLTLRLTGPAKCLARNLLAFEFTQIQFLLGDRRLYQGTVRGGKEKAEAFAQLPIGQLPFFAFFWVTDEAIAARGRGGGLALWIRQ